jgi:hypothetical protein
MTPIPSVHCDKIIANDKLLCQHTVIELVKKEHISVAAVTLAWEQAVLKLGEEM